MTNHAFLEAQGNLSAEGLVELALGHQRSHLWIGAGAMRPDDAVFSENYDVFLPIPLNKRTKMVSSLTVRRVKPKTNNTRIIWLSQSRWPFENWNQFSGLIKGVEDKLGVQMSASPTSVGLRYLEKIDQRYYKRYFADPDVDKVRLKEKFSGAAAALVWRRVPTEEELGYQYVIKVDKRAAYPRASKGSFGIGKPEVYDGAFDHLLPGVWTVDVSGLDKWDPLLPPLLWPNQNGGLVTSVVKMLIDMGCKVKVNTALIWKKRAPVFDRWVQELWDARREIDEIKLVMNNTLGFANNGQDLEDEKFRPDWYAQTVGYLRAIMFYNITKIAREGGLKPFGAYIDALYYLSPYPYVPGLSLAPESLGGYRQEWCIPLTKEVRDNITTPVGYMAFSLMLGELNRLAGEK